MRSAAVDRSLDGLAEARPVRETRQAVVAREVQVQLGEPAKLAVGQLARRDVAADALHADRPAVLLDHAARDLQHHALTALREELLLEGRALDLARHLAVARPLGLHQTLRREVVGEVRADQLLAVVAEHALERAVHVGDVVVHRDGADRLVRVLEEVAVAIVARPGGIARAGPVDRDAGEVGGELDEVGVLARALVRLAVVEREGAEQHAVRREERGRPAGAERRARGELAVVRPERVVPDVGDGDALAPVGRGAAGADVLADRDAVDRLVPEVGKARSGTVPQPLAVTVEQQDRGQDLVLGVLLDEARDAGRARVAAPRPSR